MTNDGTGAEADNKSSTTPPIPQSPNTSLPSMSKPPSTENQSPQFAQTKRSNQSPTTPSSRDVTKKRKTEILGQAGQKW
jgi:hypothetical protein